MDRFVRVGGKLLRETIGNTALIPNIAKRGSDLDKACKRRKPGSILLLRDASASGQQLPRPKSWTLPKTDCFSVRIG
jgi:hypothetical protein